MLSWWTALRTCESSLVIAIILTKKQVANIPRCRPEIRRIKRHRHIPQVVKKAGEIKNEELKSIKHREENERKHTKKQFQRRRSEREKMILAREK